jgi:hypothetical protein
VPASKPASEAEDDHDPSDYLDDEDDVMEPAPVPASKPASEAVIAEKKQQCIDTINNKLTTFSASLRDAFIERAKTAVIGQIFYWCQGLCNYYAKSLMLMSGETLEGVDRSKCPSAQFNDQILVNIAQTGPVILFCNFRGECKRTPDGKNCMDPTPEEAKQIVEVIIAFARLADALRGAVVLQICGGKQASSVMLPKLKESMKASGVGIIILNENSFHMSHYGHINSRVFFTKDLQQYLVYKDFHIMYLTLAEALEQLKTMGILDSTITLSQMLEWAQPLAGIKDHSNTPAETMNACDADYKKRCIFGGANFARAKQQRRLENRLINLKNEALNKSAEKEAEEAAKAAECNFIHTFLEAKKVALERRRQERDRKRTEMEAEKVALECRQQERDQNTQKMMKQSQE